MERQTSDRSRATSVFGAVLAIWAIFVPAILHAAPPADVLNVRDFGATGDAKTDDTAAIQRTLDEAGKTGARVSLPPGRYVLRGHLSIPEHLTLEGVSRAPERTLHNEATLEKERGSILLAYEGKGDANGPPLITLNGAAHLRGVIIFYPEQNDPKNIASFPWTVRGAGDNCTITDVLLINPYQAVDFGTEPAGRHYINGLYAQPLKTGLFIDKCFDVGRVENIHFWPFWTESAMPWTREHGTAFVIARTDWEYMTNCFCISYATGFHFLANKDGPGNAVLTQCGSDIGPLAVKIDALQSHAGVSFVNGQFMAAVEIAPTNTGPVKFTACGFWGIGNETDTHIRSAGKGHVTLTACHFSSWGQKSRSAPCILATSGSITVNGCDFLDEDGDKTHIELQPAVRSAAIFGNHFRARPKIVNNAKDGDVQIGLNVSDAGSSGK